MSEHADFELDLNLEEVNAWGGESGPMLPPGIYDLEILEAAQGVAKSSGGPVIKVTFTVLNEGEHHGKEFDKSYSLSQKALGRIKQLMVACGARLDKIRGSELVGKQIVAEIVHEQGAPYAQPDGTMKEGGMNMQIINETAPEGAEPVPPPAPTPPPPQNSKGVAVKRAVGSAKA